MKPYIHAPLQGMKSPPLQKNERTFSVVNGYDQTHNLDYVQASQILGRV